MVVTRAEARRNHAFHIPQGFFQPEAHGVLNGFVDVHQYIAHFHDGLLINNLIQLE
jgi:hypothetical protein